MSWTLRDGRQLDEMHETNQAVAQVLLGSSPRQVAKLVPLRTPVEDPNVPKLCHCL